MFIYLCKFLVNLYSFNCGSIQQQSVLLNEWVVLAAHRVENDEFCLNKLIRNPILVKNSFMVSTSDCNLLLNSAKVAALINNATSSAYICSLPLKLHWKILFTNMLNIVGEAREPEPCGRPMSILDVVLTVSPTHTNCVRSFRKDNKNSISAPDTFMVQILVQIRFWYKSVLILILNLVVP
jgi:hypothetical protein